MTREEFTEYLVRRGYYGSPSEQSIYYSVQSPTLRCVCNDKTFYHEDFCHKQWEQIHKKRKYSNYYLTD